VDFWVGCFPGFRGSYVGAFVKVPVAAVIWMMRVVFWHIPKAPSCREFSHFSGVSDLDRAGVGISGGGDHLFGLACDFDGVLGVMVLAP
jgi:hypothetical protein